MKKYIGFLTLFCFSLNLIAAPTKAPSKKSAPPPPPPKVLVLTPENLRQHLLGNNLAIMQALNDVYQAKQGINYARTQLLPSLNLGVALNEAGSGFFISTVSFLLPFLVPSNWFNYEESKYIFEAEKFSYYLLELNLYASAYTLLVTIKGDRELREVLNQQYQNLLKIQEINRTRWLLGIISETDYEQSMAETKLAGSQVSEMDKLLAKETPLIRQMLALRLEDSIEFKDFTVPPSPFEEKTPRETLDYALQVSPEFSQIGNLITASKAGKWSKAFAFISNGALSVGANENNSIAFKNMRAEAQFNFSFSYFPALALTNLITDRLELRRREIQTEQTQIIESSLGMITHAKLQLAQATEAEEGLKKVLEQQTSNYALGLTDLLHILDTQNAVVQASTARVRSQMDLNNLRINLHRAVLMDEFQKIQPCQAKQVKNSVWKEIKNFFSSQQAQKTVDQQCKGPNGKK